MAQSTFIMSICLSVHPSVTPAVSGVRGVDEQQNISSVPRTLCVFNWIFNIKTIEHLLITGEAEGEMGLKCYIFAETDYHRVEFCW